MKIAVVLFNLGGPDSPEAVRPFLFNLFSDPAILSVAQPFRWFLAQVLSRRRAPFARKIYAQIGGRSPILPLTQAQAQGLESELHRCGLNAKVFVAMRYWKPFAAETARAVKAFAPDRIVLLPLYPQFSSTTSASSVKDWEKAANTEGLAVPTVVQCCYPTDVGFVDGYADLLRKAVADAAGKAKLRVLFSAHGLPERVIKGGDPYQTQVEQSAKAIAMRLGDAMPEWRVSYQSKVGPLKWIGPSTDDEIRQAGADGVGLIIVPVAFVSEHSETLVELDIEYRELAHQSQVPIYIRVAAVGTHPAFMSGLARLTTAALEGPGLCGGAVGGGRLCPDALSQCPWKSRMDAHA